MSKKTIHFNEPYKSNKIKKYVNESLNENYYSTGIFEDKCKNILNKKFNIKNSLITHSATGALELIALYLKKKYSSSKVFMPSYTFSSTANAFLTEKAFFIISSSLEYSIPCLNLPTFPITPDNLR